MSEEARRTPRWVLVAVWLVVLLPAAWGISETIYKSMALFAAPSLHAPATAPQAKRMNRR